MKRSETQESNSAPLGEFGLIARYFQQRARTTDAVPVGIGDDCAIVQPTPGWQLAVSSDMLVEGRHFLSTVDPVRLGHKALAVNLSDLAACGAKPLGFTLALALPSADPGWLEGFSHGLLSLADAHGIALIGGDTTKGPLNICITVMGEVPPGQALLRSGARVGDELWVSGTLGDARLALEVFRGKLAVGQHLSAADFAFARGRMEQPTPRVALGQALRGIATSAIDVSDGLLGDLGHVLKASGVGATIFTESAKALLASNLIANFSIPAGAMDTNPLDAPPLNALDLVLAGGDDYELAFTAPAARHGDVLAAAAATSTAVTCIGRIEQTLGVRLVDAAGNSLPNRYAGFDHFSS